MPINYFGEEHVDILGESFQRPPPVDILSDSFTPTPTPQLPEVSPETPLAPSSTPTPEELFAAQTAAPEEFAEEVSGLQEPIWSPVDIPTDILAGGITGKMLGRGIVKPALQRLKWGTVISGAMAGVEELTDSQIATALTPIAIIAARHGLTIAAQKAGPKASKFAAQAFRKQFKRLVKARKFPISDEQIDLAGDRIEASINQATGWKGKAKDLWQILKFSRKAGQAATREMKAGVPPSPKRAIVPVTPSQVPPIPSPGITTPPPAPLPPPTGIKPPVAPPAAAARAVVEPLKFPIPPKPPLTGAGSAPPGKPIDPPIEAKAINQDYESLKDAWISEKDWQAQTASVESTRLQDQIKVTTGERKFRIKSQEIDKAIQINIDLKRNPEHLEKYWNDLTPTQQRIVKLSQSLTPEQQAIADDISRQYDAIGLKAQDAEVIRNTIDNYVARIWDVEPPKRAGEAGRKFGTTTRHAKARKFETILEGWADPRKLKLKVEGATNNLAILKEEMNNTIQDKRFLKLLTQIKDLDGNPVLSTKQLEGYVRVKHPNFKVWRFAGQTDPADLRGRNFLQTPEGTVLERKELYAPKYLAKNMNNIMGVSALKGIEAIDAITKYNAVTKSWILQTSLFHHLAFMRSYYLGSAPFGEALEKIKSGEGFIEAISGLTPRQAYKSGQKSIMDLTPEVELLVRNGLTLGKIQDWEESILRQEDTFVGRMMDKHGATKEIKNKINQFRQNQADFLFKQFGAGLKAKAALIELRTILKKNPGIDPNKAAKIAANLINDDFGGLHLRRMGRDPTTQHIFRLFALAPDWTESNIRSFVKAFKTGTEGEVYRRFWARIITKAMFATLAAGALLHGKELPEKYVKAWTGLKQKDWKHLRWMDIDITPIYKAFGGDTDARKYFSIIGHFKDPLKFALKPLKSAHYKGSVIYRAIEELRTGEDWAGREFTELPELLKTGATVRPYATFAPRSDEYSRLPSYLLNQLKGTQPIQVQQLLNWWAGETEGFDAIGQSLGLGIRTTYPPNPEQRAKQKAIRKAIKQLHPKRK